MTGLFCGRKWIRVGDECVELCEENWIRKSKPLTLFPKTISISEEDIKNSIQGDPQHCPIATHLRRVVGSDARIEVAGSTATITRNGITEKIEIATDVNEAIKQYDETGVWKKEVRRISISTSRAKTGDYTRT